MTVDKARFPPELIDLVIEFVDDQVTLASCSLIAKAFRIIGQTCLFKTVAVPPQVNISQLRGFLRENPRFTTYIENAKLSGVKSYGANYDRDLSLSELDALLAELPNLANLLVQDVYVVDDRQPQASSPPRPSLRRLVVINARGRPGTANNWTQLFNSFSFIEELILHGIPLYDSAFTASPYPVIHSIVYEEGEDTSPLCEGLIKLCDTQSVQSLDIKCIYWDDVHALASLLEKCGLSVEHLVFDPTEVCEKDDRTSETWHSLGLRYCTQLQSLVLYVSLGDGDEGGAPGEVVWDAVIAILETAPTTIRDFSFRFRIQSLKADLITSDDYHFPRASLESTLSRFPDLATVTFEFEQDAPRQYRDVCQKIITRDFMASSALKGRLRFQACRIERDTDGLVQSFACPNIR